MFGNYFVKSSRITFKDKCFIHKYTFTLCDINYPIRAINTLRVFLLFFKQYYNIEL